MGVLVPDAREQFFQNLASPTVPLSQLYSMPKLGLAKFFKEVLSRQVPLTRALWAFQVQYASEKTGCDLLEQLLRSVFDDVRNLLKPGQLSVASMLSEKLATVWDLFEAMARVEKGLANNLQAALYLFVAPFVAELHEYDPALALEHFSRCSKEKSKEVGTGNAGE